MTAIDAGRTSLWIGIGASVEFLVRVLLGEVGDSPAYGTIVAHEDCLNWRNIAVTLKMRSDGGEQERQPPER